MQFHISTPRFIIYHIKHTLTMVIFNEINTSAKLLLTQYHCQISEKLNRKTVNLIWYIMASPIIPVTTAPLSRKLILFFKSWINRSMKNMLSKTNQNPRIPCQRKLQWNLHPTNRRQNSFVLYVKKNHHPPSLVSNFKSSKWLTKFSVYGWGKSSLKPYEE